MPTDLEVAAQSRQINVLTVIDTARIKRYYPHPSKDAQKPTAIDHGYQFMLCANSRGPVSGQGTADLHFQAHIGDTVSLTAVSIYDNADDAVIVYGIRHGEKNRVFNRFTQNLITRTGAVAPNPDSQNGLPAIQRKSIFSSFDGKIKNSGTQDFHILFSLYALADNGEQQDLFGYFRWNPSITVNGWKQEESNDA
ncbi:inclusion body family protein [Collimonas arenae]|uniref:Inclusion body family protein n=1 Tax=Collimonas arenae TaxID=279058 RepID=A0A127QKB5_9BURK|nr:inclusion body family protein [Collimonas arenae]AMP00622.1 inclusion body family protein [Collimonas arenae]AMP10509.1 inclusion body family protein [Collimonas arenae]